MTGYLKHLFRELSQKRKSLNWMQDTILMKMKQYSLNRRTRQAGILERLELAKLQRKSHLTGINFQYSPPPFNHQKMQQQISATVDVCGITITKTKKLEAGMAVLRLPTLSQETGLVPRYALGEPLEDVGVITAKQPINETLEICSVKYGRFGTLNDIETDLIAYEDFVTAAVNFTPAEPIYRVDQVLYVKPSPLIQASGSYPSVGSSYETDVKVLDIRRSKIGISISYEVWSPMYGKLLLSERNLITADKKQAYIHKDFKQAVVLQNLLPLFSELEEVKIFDGFVYNHDESVAIKLSSNLEQYLQYNYH